jgi:hypothetical protein
MHNQESKLDANPVALRTTVARGLPQSAYAKLEAWMRLQRPGVDVLLNVYQSKASIYCRLEFHKFGWVERSTSLLANVGTLTYTFDHPPAARAVREM